MNAWKVTIVDHYLPGAMDCYSAIFTDKDSALRYAREFESYKHFDIRIFPILIQVKYNLSEGYEDE